MAELGRRRDAGEEGQAELGAGADHVVVGSRGDGEHGACLGSGDGLLDRQHRPGAHEHALDPGRRVDRRGRGLGSERDLDAGDAALQQRRAEIGDDRGILDHDDRQHRAPARAPSSTAGSFIARANRRRPAGQRRARSRRRTN